MGNKTKYRNAASIIMYNYGVLKLCLTPDGGSTVHVLWCVFEQAVASVVILNVVEGDGLEASPA